MCQKRYMCRISKSVTITTLSNVTAQSLTDGIENLLPNFGACRNLAYRLGDRGNSTQVRSGDGANELRQQPRMLHFGSRGEAAVYLQARAGNIRRFGTCEIGNHARDFVTLAVALDRYHGFQLCGEWAVRRIHIGVHRSGLNVVDRNTARAEIAGETELPAPEELNGLNLRAVIRSKR
jgi:hypothetical protein